MSVLLLALALAAPPIGDWSPPGTPVLAGGAVGSPALDAVHSDTLTDGVSTSVSVDPDRREVSITIAPLTIPDLGKGHGHGGRGRMSAHETRLYRATWPISGWLRGFRVELYDSTGRRLPRRHLHHVSMVNLSRRQLLYPAYERLLGASQEQASFRAPSTVGVPLDPGMKLGTFIGWHNDSGREIPGARLVLRMEYLPANWMPRPTPIRLLWLDVAYRSGATDAYDLPPGPSSKTFEFTLPVGGRVLLAGGHLHDYAKFVRLEDAESGKVLIDLPARTDPAGRLKAVPRRVYGVVGDGLRLKADRRYRLRADYDNPEPELLKRGAMALIVAAFVPDDPARWPAVDPEDPGLQRDLAMLESLGRPSRPRATTTQASETHGHDH